MALAQLQFCWWPFLTRAGVTLGLVAGLIAVTLTEKMGTDWFGITAWGRWPLTIHSAGWGIIFNFRYCNNCVYFTPDERILSIK